MKLLKDLNINKMNNLIALSVFGSYETEYWIKGKSDIDILVLIEKRDSVMDEFDLEDELEPVLKEYFEYDKIHLTFINMRDFDSIFARQYIDSEDKLIIDEFKEIDFRLYVNKFIRENDNLIKKIDRDNKLVEEYNGGSIL
ncbi:nucleotidyltransferase domain-containing protein [Clostridium sp. B9]|uniref:nucleotidyltransferase domain-containing protein n=1 Tax=Clostridium sp. B9 TaxID=3423224 RepID=UPI003D2F0A03